MCPNKFIECNSLVLARFLPRSRTSNDRVTRVDGLSSVPLKMQIIRETRG